jgi:hypothetical protein
MKNRLARIFNPLTGRTQRDDLGMRRRVRSRNRPIPALADHIPVEHHDRAHRHLALGPTLACEFESPPHEILIAHSHSMVEGGLEEMS